MAKIKETRKGNVKLTLTRDETQALYNGLSVFNPERFEDPRERLLAVGVDHMVRTYLWPNS